MNILNRTLFAFRALPSSRSLRDLAIPTLGTLALVSGCVEEPTQGSVIVPFQVGSGVPCDHPDAEISKVRVTLGGEYENDASCESGEVRVDGVPAGNYDILVEGIDSSGVTIVDNFESDTQTIEVLGGSSVTTDQVELAFSPAQLYLRWNIDDGYSTCENTNVANFKISTWETDGISKLLAGALACSTSGIGDDGYRLLDDPDRKLVGDEFGKVTVQPIDGSGIDVGPELVFDFAPPGHGYTIELTLACGQDSCECATTDCVQD